MAGAPDASEAVQLISANAKPLPAPQLSVDSSGQVRLSWADDEGIQLAAAESRWHLSFKNAQATPLTTTMLVFRDGSWIAWDELSGDVRSIWAQQLDEPKPEAYLDVPASAVFTVDSRGIIHAAWSNSGHLYYANSQLQTFEYELTASASDLAICASADNRAYIIWRQTGETAEQTGIYLLQAQEQAEAIRIAPEGTHPQVRAGARVHAAFIANGSLAYANSDNWQSIQIVTQGITQDIPFRLALGQDDTAYLAWYQNNQIHQASAVNWELSPKSIATGGLVSSLDLAIDSRGSPHVLFCTPYDSTHVAVYYAKTINPIFQVAFAANLASEFIQAPYELDVHTNLADSELLKISFYLMLGDQTENPTFMPLGVDTDGSDGWSISLNAPGVKPQQVRACALATSAEGNQARTCSAVFTLIPKDWPDIWLDHPALLADPLLYAFIAPELGRTPINLYAQPSICKDSEATCPALPRSTFLGQYTLEQPEGDRPVRQRLEIDSSKLSDGEYTIYAAVAKEPLLASAFSTPVEIRHLIAPSVTITAAPEHLAVGDMLEVQANVVEGEALATHVDFYLAQAQASRLESIWLGSAKPSDNYRIRVPVKEFWIGDSWSIKAIAYDKEGLYSVAYSASTVSITNPLYPYLEFVQPKESQALSGMATVEVSSDTALSPQDFVQAYISADSAEWKYLGTLQPGNMWTFQFDTRRWPNGHYTLMTTVHLAGISYSKPAFRDIVIDNPRSDYVFSSPRSGSQIQGDVFLGITSAITQIVPQIHFVLQDNQANYYDLGEAHSINGSYGMMWNSRLALDGAYTVTAFIAEPGGKSVELGKAFVINNSTPQVHFINLELESLKGRQTICWQGSSEMPASVHLDYSPDEGSRWLTIASHLPLTGCYDWDTKQVPDSTRAILRATVHNTSAETATTSKVFQLNNVPEAPALAIIAPADEATQQETVRIAWQSWSPDGDLILVNLAYRLADGYWTTLGDSLPATGDYTWDISGVSPGSCELRITAQAASGLTATLYRNIVIAPTERVTIRLFSPNGGETLKDEALILWNIPSLDKKQVWVDVYFSDNGGQSWLPLVEGLQNTNSYRWQLAFLPPGNQYRVKVIARTRFSQAEAASAGTFTIGSPPSQQLELVQPLNNEIVKGLRLIQWRVTPTSQRARTARLAVRAQAQPGWMPIVQDIPDDGWFVWDTRQLPDGTYELRVSSLDADGTAVEQSIIIELQNTGNRPPEPHISSPLVVTNPSSLVPLRWKLNHADNRPMTATLQLLSDTDQVTHLDQVNAAQEIYWLAPDMLTSAARLRLLVSDGITESADETAITFLTYEPVLHVFTDEQLLTETAQLHWSAQDNLGKNYAVSLHISPLDNPASQKIIPNITSGMYPLGLQSLEPGKTYLVQLQAMLPYYREVSPVMQLPIPKPLFLGPKLEVQLPAIAAPWSGIQEITWKTDDPLGRSLSIQIDISDDGGLSWATLAKNAAVTGTFAWDTTEFANGLYLIKVTADNQRATTVWISSPLLLANRGNERPRVSLLSTDERVWSGSHTLRWVTQQWDHDAARASLGYSVDEGATWEPIVTAIPDQGSYVLDTRMLPNAQRVWIRLLVSDGQFTAQDTLDAPICIDNKVNPSIHLTQPAPEANHPENLVIAWQGISAGSQSLVTLEYSSEGLIWQVLATNLPASGSYIINQNMLPAGKQLSFRAIIKGKRGSGIATAQYTTLPSAQNRVSEPFAP